MVFSDKGFSFLTGLTGFSGFLCCFFPFPEEKEKDNPPAAEGVLGDFWLLTSDFRSLISGIRGFLRRPKMAL
ncbi:MAG: hypothetical protein U9N82_07720 [Thermodesulfobacteriota bacterium]|nr:hypothetical protein [Thermodesulfobacteriota bacterium]